MMEFINKSPSSPPRIWSWPHSTKVPRGEEGKSWKGALQRLEWALLGLEGSSVSDSLTVRDRDQGLT